MAMVNQIQLMYLAAFFMDASVAGLHFALGRRAAELQATPLELGLLGSIWVGLYTPTAIFSGHWSDRIGSRPVIVMGCLVAGLSALSCGLTANIAVLLALTGLFGIGLGCFWPPMLAWLGEGVSGQRLLERLTKFNVGWNLGLAAGLALTGWVYSQWPTVAFWISGGLILGLAGMLSVRAPPPSTDEQSASTLHVIPVDIPKGMGFRQTAWVANFALMFGIGGLNALFPRLAIELSIDANAQGVLMALARAAALVAFIGLNWLQFWRTRLWPLWLAQIGAAAGLFLVGTVSTAWLLAFAFVVVGAVSGYTYQASIMFTLEEMTEKGKGSGLHEAILASGMCLGPLLAGWFGGLTGQLRAPYYFCGAVVIVLVATQILIVVTRRYHLAALGK